MIKYTDLNPHRYLTTDVEDGNMSILFDRLSKLEAFFGKPFVVTSGLRSMVEQMRINPKAPSSKHIYGQAADIYDPKQELQTWCYDNVEHLEAIGLWCEDFRSTPNWVHFQIVPPRSGHRFFVP